MKDEKWEKVPTQLSDFFYSVLNEFPEAELRKMFGCPCAFLNGNMFVGLHESNFIIRLPQEYRSMALEKKMGTVFAPMKGRVMKEYLNLSPSLLNDAVQLKSIILISLEYVKSLPIKVKKSRKSKKSPQSLGQV